MHIFKEVKKMAAAGISTLGITFGYGSEATAGTKPTSFKQLTRINAIGGIAYFDFGKSTERHGEYLNEQLIFQKEGFGGRAVCYDTYVWTVGAGLVAKKQNNDNQGK